MTRLSKNEIADLIKYHKEVKSKSDSDKLKCIIYWGKGWSWKQIKEALFISDGTIKSYVDHYKKGNLEELLTSRYDGHNRKLTDLQEKELSNYVINNPIYNTKQVCRYVEKTFGIKYTINGIENILTRLGFIFKKQDIDSYKIDPYLQGIHLGLSYFDILLQVNDDEDIYFVNVNFIKQHTSYGWVRESVQKNLKTNKFMPNKLLYNVYNIKNKEVIGIQSEKDDKIELIDKILKLSENKSKITLMLYNIPLNEDEELLKYINKQNIKIKFIHIPPYISHLKIKL